MKTLIEQSIFEALKKLNLGDAGEICINHPAESKYGDFTSNVAMILNKVSNKTPGQLAMMIEKNIEKDDLIEKIEVVGGYINFFLNKNFLIKEAKRINHEIEFRKRLASNFLGKKVIVEYSSPNIAKPFGIGHLRSTNIGQAIFNIYKILGWECIGDNHLGDWGTQFGKMIVAIKYWADKDIKKMTISDLEKLYVKFHHEAESNPRLEDEARDWFVKLEKEDIEARKLWKECVEISLKEFERVYKLLDVKIENAYGEAFYEKMLPEVVEDLKKTGLTRLSEKALIVEFEDKPPAILLKSDGGTTYFTRDMATIKFRIEKWNPDLIIYEVGSEQILHFKQVFDAAIKMGWVKADQLYHLPHGLLRWTTGKFSTRHGDTIHLSDVIDKAMEEARKLAPNNNNETIEAVAIGAIKFNDLCQDPVKDIIFDWKKVMSMEGNSSPYLQYTYARCKSVLNKSKILERRNIEKVPDDVSQEEMALLREFYKFEEVIVEAAERYNPAVVAMFLLTIARKYNEFYGKYRIIDTKNEVWRLFITKTTASILKMGLNLLGIKTIDKM